MSTSAIQHIFVLMLENRSFDHLLGFSRITGIDAVTGGSAKIGGLTGSESNGYNGAAYKVSSPADLVMTVDPGHEFPNVLTQLAGPGAQYPAGGAYPPIINSGYVADLIASGGGAIPGDIMKCFAPGQLPVLNALARNFVLCDNWFSSMPGPTWPNRFFLLGGSSGGLDHSPTTDEVLKWETVDGFSFQHGSIFDRIGDRQRWRIYAGDLLTCMAHALKGIHLADLRLFSGFAADLGDPNYPAQFTLIEPNYGHLTSDYKGGNSQHPLDDITSGEALIKATYEAIRNSPLWPSSMLIVTWDEHGGFYDHAAPPAAQAPGDAPQFADANRSGFTFQQYGVRVPAVVVSPLVPANLIDHRVYDHTSVLATVEAAFGMAPLTQRDASANSLLALASLGAPRGDAPATLPEPAAAAAGAAMAPAATTELPGPPATRPDEAFDSDRNMPGFLYMAMRNDLDVSPPAQRAAIQARVRNIQTRGDAHAYFEEVRGKIPAAGPR